MTRVVVQYMGDGVIGPALHLPPARCAVKHQYGCFLETAISCATAVPTVPGPGRR